MIKLEPKQTVKLVDPNCSFLAEWVVDSVMAEGQIVLKREEKIQVEYDGEKYLETGKPVWVARWVMGDPL